MFFKGKENSPRLAAGENSIVAALRLIKRDAKSASGQDLKQAAGTTQSILSTIALCNTELDVRGNKGGVQRLAEDVASLFLAIWRSYARCEDHANWLSPLGRKILVELQETLNSISDFVEEQLEKDEASRKSDKDADGRVIKEYQVKLQEAMCQFRMQIQVLKLRERPQERTHYPSDGFHEEEREKSVTFVRPKKQAKDVQDTERNLEDFVQELERLRAEAATVEDKEVADLKGKGCREALAKQQEGNADLEQLRAEGQQREAFKKQQADKVELERLRAEKRRREARADAPVLEVTHIKTEENRRQAEAEVQRRVKEVREHHYGNFTEEDASEDDDDTEEEEEEEEVPVVPVNNKAREKVVNPKPPARRAQSAQSQPSRPAPPFALPNRSATHPMYANSRWGQDAAYQYTYLGPSSFGYHQYIAPNIGIAGGEFGGNCRPVINQGSGNFSDPFNRYPPQSGGSIGISGGTFSDNSCPEINQNMPTATQGNSRPTRYSNPAAHHTSQRAARQKV
ncbi:hypothetical protein B0H34DRAFT_279617 [Crassisporium funariophilum]|nr:hypothetical protein B0H34DRAFT_279617 [Crassisporium funariophilum]